MVYSALTIAGSDPSSGAGVQADLKTFSAHRVHGLMVLTSLTAQSTLGVSRVMEVPVGMVLEQLETLSQDFAIAAAKTGMLWSRRIIQAIAGEIGSYPLVVDPVMVSESGSMLLAEDALEALRERLLPRALLTTPNIHEAEVLSGVRISSVRDMEKACREIAKLGCSVVVKGGHLNAVDLLYAEGRLHRLEGVKREGTFHGSGCTFAAAVTANLALGFDLVRAVKNAKRFTEQAIDTSYELGRGGMRFVNQSRIPFPEELDEVRREVWDAVLRAEGMEGLERLAPEVGMNICYAREKARSIQDVAALTGRLVRAGGMVRAVGTVEYGGSSHVARVVLAAMDFNPSFRAAMNIAYKAELLEAAEKLCGMRIASFDRREEPPGAGTMEWGTREAISRIDAMPDLIYDEGAQGKEAMIRILGAEPRDVLDKVERILAALSGGSPRA